MVAAPLQVFLRWLAEGGAELASGASDITGPGQPYSGPGLGVVAARDVAKDTLLYRIPKHVLLSARTTAVSSFLESSGLAENEGAALTGASSQILEAGAASRRKTTHDAS